MDPVRTEVMRSRFAAIAAEASFVAFRSAHTTFVKQTQDYQVALASIDGDFFAFPVASGVTSSICQNVRGLVDEIGIDTLVEGDIIISNDPFSGAALCTHSMDIHLLKPVFFQGRVVAFAWAFIHASDIGGSVPGSIDPTNYEIFQEGLRITPTLLYRAGQLDGQIWQFFASNTRIPDLIWGDLNAMISGISLLETRALEICSKFGLDYFLGSVADVLELADQKAQKALRQLRPGTYSFNDYLEGYRGEAPIFINGTMTVGDGRVTMDFSGSDPQVNYSMNFPSDSVGAHPFLCMPILLFIQTMEPDVPINAGMARPITTQAPRGTLMNATFPAAGGNRAITFTRMYDVILGCLNQAIPEGLAAAGSGIAGIISVATFDPSTGERHVSVVEPFLGGGGARRYTDGVHGMHQSPAFLRSAPVEIVEGETPLVVREFSLLQDSPGAGKYRGGAAFRIELELVGVSAIITVRGLDRFLFEPWGFSGGECGSRAEIILNPGTAQERDIGKLEVLEMKQGDILRMTTASGGGFGPAFERDPLDVQDDVANGFVSEEQARSRYGVAITVGGTLDAAATAALRRVAGTARAADGFNFGAERRKAEALWPPEVRAELANIVLSAPKPFRRHWMGRLQSQFRNQVQPVTTAALQDAFQQLSVPIAKAAE